MTAYNREHLQAYRVPEIDPDVSEEYKQMLTTEGLGYDYTPEFQLPVWKLRQAHFAISVQLQESSGSSTVCGIYRGTVMEEEIEVF